MAFPVNGAAGSVASGDSQTIWQVMARVRRALAWALAFSVPLHLALMAVPLAAMLLLGRAELGAGARTVVAATVLGLLGGGVALGLAVLRGHICRRSGFWMQRQLMAAKLACLSTRTASPDARELELGADATQLSRVVPPVADAIASPLYIFALLLVDGQVALMALALGAAMLGIAYGARRSAAPALLAADELQARGSTARRELRGAGSTVVALGLVLPLAERAGAEEERCLRQREAAERLLARHALMQGAAVLVLALSVPALLTLNGGGVPAGPLAAALLLVLGFGAIWIRMASAWPRLAALQAGMDALLRNADAHVVAAEPMQLPPPEAELVVERAGWRAPLSGARLLQEIDFTLQPGDSLGIVGPSGAGKSVLARLLAGTVAPTSGRVRLGGRDLGRPERAEIAPHVGYLPQEIDLFSGTVADNIARLAPVRGQGRAVMDAAQQAGCHEAILALPQGYDTPVGEGGRLLSGGLRQRIGLARALFGAPRLLVLDEPNAHLDEDGEAALAAAIAAAKRRGCVVVIVGQRPGGLETVEKFLVLKDGRVELFGARQEVSDALRQRRLAERSAAQRKARKAAAEAAAATAAASGSGSAA